MYRVRYWTAHIDVLCRTCGHGHIDLELEVCKQFKVLYKLPTLLDCLDPEEAGTT